MATEFNGEAVLILGAGVMQMPALEAARELGLSAIAVDGDARAPGRGLASRFENIDLKDVDSILAFARSVKAEARLCGVFTAGTDFSPTVADLARALGLPGIGPETARRAQDKALMRKAFADSGVPSPRHASVTGIETLDIAIAAVPGPWVVKPVDSMGARGCRRVDERALLAEAVSDALRYSRSGRAIIEEYMEGPEFSVDALVWKGEIAVCGLADRHIFYPPYFIEMGHTMPSSFPPATVEEVLSVFKAGIRAIGIDMGAAKGDIKLGRDGKARVGEIAARLSGGYMSGWTYPYSSGVGLTKAALRIAAGRAPGDLSPRLSLTSAERAWISIPGKIAEIRGLEDAGAAPGVRDIFQRAKKGDRAVFPRNNVEKCGNAIAVDADPAKARSAAESACRSVLLRLEPGDAETDSFLSEAGAAYPPDAFAGLPARFLADIEGLPDSVPGAEGAGIASIGVIPLDLSGAVGSRDYQGRSLEEALQAALSLCGAALGRGARLIGKPFWKALVRGSYQGGAYVLDGYSGAREREGGAG